MCALSFEDEVPLLMAAAALGVVVDAAWVDAAWVACVGE